MKVWITTAIALVFLNIQPVQADDSPRHQIVDGVNVYLGVMPTAMIQDQHDMPKAKLEHQGQSSEAEFHHILIALIDAQTGQRLSPISIDAEVSGLGGLAAQFKSLEAMNIHRTVSYGNYFHFPDRGSYRLRFTIHLSGRDSPVVTEFMYSHPGN